MVGSPNPTVKRKRLGIELRRLREAAGLTCEQVGERLGYSGTRISRIETGKISAKPGDVHELLEVYGLTGPEASALVQLARDARKKGWWHTYGRSLPQWFSVYVGFESEAVRFRDFQPLYVPGLLQTEAYARAVLQAAPAPGTPDDITRQVAVRMERQGILTQPKPPELWFVISEAALRVQAGSPEIMRAQLEQLADLAAQPNITIQVLPLSSAAHANPITGFRMLDFADPKDPTLVYIEHLTGALFLEDEGEVRRYTVVFDHLRAEALGPSSSLDLIRAIMAEMGSTT